MNINNVNIYFDKNTKTTLLHKACKENNIIRIKLLLQKGADVNAININNNTALHYVTYHSKNNSCILEIIKLLCDYKIKSSYIYLENKNKNYPLYYVYNNTFVNKNILEYLLSKQMDINKIDVNGNTLLSYIFSHNDTHIINMMIQIISDNLRRDTFSQTNFKQKYTYTINDINNDTLLMITIKKGYKQLTEWLLNLYENIGLEEISNEGYTIFDLICLYNKNYDNIEKIYLWYVTNNIKLSNNINGQNPLILYCIGKNDNTLNYINNYNYFPYNDVDVVKSLNLLSFYNILEKDIYGFNAITYMCKSYNIYNIYMVLIMNKTSLNDAVLSELEKIKLMESFFNSYIKNVYYYIANVKQTLDMFNNLMNNNSYEINNNKTILFSVLQLEEESQCSYLTKCILKKKINYLNIYDKKEKKSVLDLICMNIGKIKIYLNNGFYLNFIDGNGNNMITILLIKYMGIMKVSASMRKIFLRDPIIHTKTNRELRRILAKTNPIIEIIEYLCCRGIDINYKNIILLAYQCESLEVLTIFINKNININIKDSDGNNCLHYACNYLNDYNHIEYLLKNIKLNNINNNNNKSPLYYLKCLDQNLIIKLFEDYGFN